MKMSKVKYLNPTAQRKCERAHIRVEGARYSCRWPSSKGVWVEARDSLAFSENIFSNFILFDFIKSKLAGCQLFYQFHLVI